MQAGKKFINFQKGRIEEVPDELATRLLTKTSGFEKYEYSSETKPKNDRKNKNKEREEE